jgi:hypothetical protein
MKRKSFLKLIPAAGVMPFINGGIPGSAGFITDTREKNYDSREYWVSVIQRIAGPVLHNLSEGKLKANMPVESSGKDREKMTHLEAFGRTLAGIAPWLELGPENTAEGELRATFLEMTRKCVSSAVDPSSKDYMNFTEGGQPLVDTAFLAHGLLRAYSQLWLSLDVQVKQRVITALKSTRDIEPGNSNWLLFSAIIEAFLLKSGSEWDNKPIGFALNRFSEWYKGDGLYGDGPLFHWDYYNSFVIQPMLLDVVKTLNECNIETDMPYRDILNRARRYAAIQERMISPEGTYPPIGRSLCYRFGAFQLLAQIALMKQLPGSISQAQVRSALSAVISRQVEAPGTFDSGGWLTIGTVGHQPGIGEFYISTGSLYLCLTGLLPLGLPADDLFWSMPPADWTSRKIWNGIDLPPDHAFEEG